MHALYEGIILGLSLAFIFGYGPAFFALIQTALHRGFREGVLLAFGIFLNDLIIIVLGLIGSVNVIKGSENYRLMGIIGGALLIVFGIGSFGRKKTGNRTQSFENGNPHFLYFIGKGFLLNLMNPFIWIFWLTVIVSATASYKANTFDLMLFFAGTLATVFLTDTLKVLSASKLSMYVTDNFLKKVNIVAGAGLIVFGVWLILRAVFDF